MQPFGFQSQSLQLHQVTHARRCIGPKSQHPSTEQSLGLCTVRLGFFIYLGQHCLQGWQPAFKAALRRISLTLLLFTLALAIPQFNL